METPATTAPADAGAIPRLERMVLDRLFGEQSYAFDLYEGTVVNAADTRIIYLSADIIRGIYEALNFEAGDAWRIILKTCGTLWGQRMARSMEREVTALTSREWQQFSVSEYVDLLEGYFSRHGWGKAKIHLEDAASHGIIRMSMTHSLFATALNHVEGPVDYMVAGMLKGLFEAISGQTLDALEVQSPRRDAAPSCEFLVSAVDRIAAIEPLVGEGLPLEEILDRLRQT